MGIAVGGQDARNVVISESDEPFAVTTGPGGTALERFVHVGHRGGNIMAWRNVSWSPEARWLPCSPMTVKDPSLKKGGCAQQVIIKVPLAVPVNV